MCDMCLKEFSFQAKKSYIERERHYCSRLCRSSAMSKGGPIYEALASASMKKYGTRHPMQSVDVKKKLAETFRQRYGVDHNFKIPEIRDARNRTWDTIYGGRPSKHVSVKEKMFQTNIVRYGAGSPLASSENIEKSHGSVAKARRFETLKISGGLMKSALEDAVYNVLVDLFGRDAIERWVRVFDHNIDFYIKTIDTYVEFDGVYFHGLDRPLDVVMHDSPHIYKKYLRDRELDKLMQEASMKLFRIREDDFKKSGIDVIIPLLGKEK